jgi:hypothetical protein
VVAADALPQHRALGKPVHHDGGCGERIPSPHPECQAWAEPYNAAEIRRTSLTSAGPVRVIVMWIDCHVCGRTVQRSETAT